MNRYFPNRDFLFYETAYYAQPHRKLAIIYDDFLYIYSKQRKKEELYDLRYTESYERCNMISDTFYDVDRQLETSTRELFFSPRWDEIDYYRNIFRKKRKEVWRDAPLPLEIKERFISFAKKNVVKVLPKNHYKNYWNKCDCLK